MSGSQITQAMIDAYDEYTHLTLDRRGFMEKLTKLAGSSAAAAAIVPLLSANSARAAIVAEDDERLASREITYQGADGDMKAYLVRPAEQEEPLGAVIVIHENRGLNDHIGDVARRMALEGFVALAPDFLSPLGGTPDDEDEARQMFGRLEAGQTVANGIATIAYLETLDGTNGNVGAVGFCWGGGTVNNLAVNAPSLDAAVAYYGVQPDSGDVAGISAPLLLHYAEFDERINAGIDDFRDALDAAGKEYTIHIYEGVNHAFNNDTSEARYDRAAADLAWQRTVSFLGEKLAGD